MCAPLVRINLAETANFEDGRIEQDKSVEELEDLVGFLYSNTPCAKYRRVNQYITDKRSKQLMGELLPRECCKGVAITVATTVGGAMMGVGVGGLAGGPPGAIAGGVIVGIGGFALGTYLSSQVMKQPFQAHYKAWKAELRDEKCFQELSRISKEDMAFAECEDPITLERFESPYMINRCGHTFEANEIAKVIALSILGNPACPLCRTTFTEADVEPDIVMIAKMKGIYGQLAEQTALHGNYSPEIKKAFAAMAKDSQQQIENIYTECSAELLLKFKEKHITFSVYNFKKRQLDEKFQTYLE